MISILLAAVLPLVNQPFTYEGRIVDFDNISADAWSVPIRAYNSSGQFVAKCETFASTHSAYNYRLAIPIASQPTDGYAVVGESLTFRISVDGEDFLTLVPVENTVVGSPGDRVRCDLMLSTDADGGRVSDDYVRDIIRQMQRYTSAAGGLPEGYTAVEYIVAPRDSYINTGYKPNQDTRVAMDVTVQGAREYWFGAWNVAWNDGAYALGNDNGEVYCGYGSGATCGGIKVDDKGLPNGRVTVALEKGVVYTNDVVWSNAHRSDATFSVEYNLYLFAQNRKGTAKPGDGQGDIICHGCTISEGEMVKRDFVPCVRMSDGAVGFYDLAATGADKVFYANDGTGTFAIPPEARCTVTIGDYPHITAAWTSGDGSVTNAVKGGFFMVEKGTSGVKVIFTAKRNYVIVEGESVVELGNVESDIVFGEGNDYVVPTAVCTLDPVDYLDWDDVEKKMTNATLTVDYEIVSSETRTFEDGKWYVVADDVEISGHNIKVNGSAHLILCDNASLAVKDLDEYNAAIDVAIDVSVRGSTTNSLTIYGQQNGSGVLTATGGYGGAGIGGGGTGSGGSVTVNGGLLTASGGQYGAGIGGGVDGAGGTVTINGGLVTATGGENGAGIGGGWGYHDAGIGGIRHGAGGVVTINGGLVTATGGENGAGIGGGYNGEDGKVKLGKKVVVVEGMCGNGSSYAKIVNIGDYPIVTVGAFEHMTAAWTSGDGSVTNALSGRYFVVKNGTENVKVIFTAKRNFGIPGNPVVQLDGAVTENVAFGMGNDYAVPTVRCVLGDIAYLYWDDANGKMTNATLSSSVYEIVASTTTAFEDGKWYVVADDVEINDGGNITVSGSSHLILCDEGSLAIMNVAFGKAAIDASVSGSTTNSLTIYGQQGGSGVLTATGGVWGAGIGGGYNSAGGVITINGGSVTATGGDSGAGIGGGEYGAGGFVTINGGLVTATGGRRGAGIGGGYDGEDGKVELGKNVEVVEGMYGNGSSYAKIVEVWTLGETVTAYVNDDGTLVIGGTGAMYDFASAADAPWAAIADEITAVTIAESVTHVGKNAFAGMENLTSINGEDVKSTYRTVSTVNGKPIEQFNMMGGALGYAPLAYPSESPAQPSGAISGAEFDAVQIIDGKAYLDVSVYTSDAITNQNWSVATNGVIEVPAPGKQGFFYLMSKPSVPSNKPFVPPPLPIEQ